MIWFCDVITTDLYEKSNLKKSLSREKTLGMTESTGFTGSVVANWLQKSVINLLSE